jgi:hypothetical protein
MHKLLLILITMTVFVACNNNASTDNPADDSLSAEEQLIPEERLAWVTVYDSVKNNYVLKQQRQVNAEQLTPESVISDINATWENVKLEFKKISNDTLYVTIPQSDYLTQQMGSSGSSEYFATATFNLTELKGIRFVNYYFQEGDHAQPGTYSRESFKEFQ